MTDKIHYELVEWTDKFLELAIWKMLNVPSEYKLVSLIAIGYPASDNFGLVHGKRPVSEVLHWERF